MNLSKSGYKVHEYKILGYNLNFVPTPENINKKELLLDINKFNRKIKLRAHFGTSLPEGGLYFKNNSEWEPGNVHHTVKTFTEDFKNRVKHNINKNGQNLAMNRKNLSKKETKAMDDLSKRDDIVVCKANKGGAVVITDVEDYINKANRQLNDKRFYKKVEENPTRIETSGASGGENGKST